MQFAPCVRCQIPTLETDLRLGLCLACQKAAEPPKTAQQEQTERLMKAVEHGERTRAERAALKEGLSPKPRKPKPEADAPPAPRNALVDQELARRELCRRKLMPFVLRFNEHYDPGWVHHLICAELEQFERDVVERKSPRLIIQVPPRHGKSELVSRQFPPWFLGRNPEMEIIGASHTAALSMDFSRKARSIARNPAFTSVFPGCVLSEDSQAAEQWRTVKGGGFNAVGVGSAVVGKGAHVLLIDDPVAGAQEADSFKAREEVKQWFQTEAYTRLAPGGGVLIIMQRWHDDDLAGWLLARAKLGEGETYRVVSFPAIATEDEQYRKKGEALHPSRYPLELLENIKRNMTPRQWEALYQQNPVPDDGTYFKNDYFRFYKAEDRPQLDTLNVYSTWDLAIAENEQNDYTAGFAGGVNRNDDLYILAHRHDRWPAMQIVEEILDDQRDSKSQIVGLEKGQIQMTIEPFLRKRMRERRQMGFLVMPLAVGRRDKMARARSIQGRMEQGRVFWPAEAPWLSDVMRELLRFPSGQHDDRVDAIAHMGLLLDSMVPTRAPAEKPKKGWMDRARRLAATRHPGAKTAMSS